LRVDDGKPPADTNTFVVTTGPSLTSLAHHGHNDHNSNKHNGDNGDNGHDDHDGHDNDGVIATDTHAEPVGTLTTMAVDDATQTNLLDIWIVNPGSNTHVVNSEAWKGWKRTSNNPECHSINAGNSCILITAWGTIDLVARTPHGQLTLELTHVAYVEGFLTSVLGLARCQTESIHFDSGRNILYMHQPLTSSRNSNTTEDTG
jgi:hypothetical protein